MRLPRHTQRATGPKAQLFLHGNVHSRTVEPGAWWALRGGSDGGSIPGRVHGTAGTQLPSQGPRTEGLHSGQCPVVTASRSFVILKRGPVSYFCMVLFMYVFILKIF